MSNLSNINVRIEKNIKDASEKILTNLGLNMSVAINIYLRQIIKLNGIPFVIKGEIPTLDTIEAMEEAISISNNGEKGFSSVKDLRNALDK